MGKVSKEILILGKETFDKLKPDVQRFIKQQSQQISDLETKLGDMEQEQIKEMQEHQEAMQVANKTITNLVEDNRASQEWYKKQLAESEKKHLLDEKEWQDYCAFKHIEPQIKGCLDREREYEKQLAESEETIKYLKGIKRYDIGETLTENIQLKHQLADKEKEIEMLNDNWNVLCDYLGDCVVKYDEEDVNGIYREVLDKVNILKRYDYKRHQDKISFALEQLEKVKENIIDRLADIDRQFMEDLWDEEQYARMCWENWDTEKFIDNQIKQLKEGK